VQPLRIAMVVPPWLELPPEGYGGLEVIAAALIDGLADRGHEVTLFGAGTRNGTRARFVTTNPVPQYARLNRVDAAALHTAEVNQLLAEGDFDIVHDHTVDGPMTAPVRPVPTVATVHNKADGEVGAYLAALGRAVRLVAISWSQRLSQQELNWAATVHNGLCVEDIPGGIATPDGPCVWLARFTPDKGPDLAIDACRAAGLPLVLAGKATERGELRYLDETIVPMLHDGVRLLVNADRATTQQLLAEARCLILPLRWAEPFGMVMIEAMAAGTPVVALNRGAVPELVVDGVTGFVRERPEELPAALHRCHEIDANNCVAHVCAQFSAPLMASRYERVYLDTLASGRPAPRPRRPVNGRRFTPARVSVRSRWARY
jgi:glycosyltransferase involved in cell wall biosynthesis